MKKILTFLLIGMLMLSCTTLTGCGKKESSKTEYTMDEFADMYNETQSLFKKEAEKAYLTDEERYSEKGQQLYKKCSEKTGLPFNKELTHRGVKYQGYGCVDLKSNDEKTSIQCLFAQSVDNFWILIPDGTTVSIKGTFSPESAPGAYGTLFDVSLVSPDIDIKYEPTDIKDALKVITNEQGYESNIIIEGEISEIMTRDEVEEIVGGYVDISSALHDDAALIKGQDGSIIIFYDKTFTGELTAGDKIAVQGALQNGFGYENPATKKYSCLIGVMPDVDNCYNFTAHEDDE